MQMQESDRLSGSMPSSYKKRTWAHNIEFIFTCLSMSIGLGNLYRFPYVCYANGGGAFLIPYCIVTALMGMPMYYLDIAVGQFSSRGPIRLYNSLCKGWSGYGWSQAFVCTCVMSYYGHILAIDIHYFIKSFAFNLPWNFCPTNLGNSCVSIIDLHSFTNLTKGVRSSAEVYLSVTVLKEFDDIDDGLGYPDWEMLLCLATVWTLAVIYLLFGIKTAGIFSYFTATFPFIILFILLIRSCTLDGAWDGCVYFLRPEFHKLLEIKVWLASVQQVFFNFGFGYGTIAMYASYNEIHRPGMALVAIVLAISTTACSVLCGLCIFTAMGHLAFKMGVGVDEVITASGITLAFISYPAGISHFPSVPYLFAIVFFFMVFVLGIGSLCSFQQHITTNMLEYVNNIKEWQVAILTGVLGFTCGIIYTTRGGGAIVTMVDIHGSCNVLAILGFIQVIALVYTYGLQFLAWDVEYMTRKKCFFYLRWSWAIVAPLTLLVIYGYSFSEPYILSWKGKDLPLIAQLFGLSLIFINLSPILICKIMWVIRLRRSKCKDIRQKLYSQEDWFPLQETREAEEFRNKKMAAYPVPKRGCFKRTLCALAKNY